MLAFGKAVLLVCTGAAHAAFGASQGVALPLQNDTAPQARSVESGAAVAAGHTTTSS